MENCKNVKSAILEKDNDKCNTVLENVCSFNTVNNIVVQSLDEKSRNMKKIFELKEEIASCSKYEYTSLEVCNMPDNDTKDCYKTACNDNYVTSLQYSNKHVIYDNCLGSPDIFSEKSENENVENFTGTISSKLLQNFSLYSKELLDKLEKALQGVPPPPSVTISQLSAEKILELYKTNIQLCNVDWIFDDVSKVQNSSIKTISPIHISKTIQILHRNCTNQNMHYYWNNCNECENLAKNGTWSQMKIARYYDVYYNSTVYSEDVDCLLSRYLSRYVGCETASSCIAAISACKSPLKRHIRLLNGKSPGKRLSHLARRKLTLCSAKSYQDTFHLRRQILIDKKKYTAALKLNRKSPKFKKTPTKAYNQRRTPKSTTPRRKRTSSQKKNIKHTTNKDVSKTNPRRALFLSPEGEKICLRKKDENTSNTKINTLKRSLFISSNDEKCNLTSKENSSDTSLVSLNLSNNVPKRIKLDTDPNIISKVKLCKSLSFGGDKIINAPQENIVKPLIKYASEHFPSKYEEISEVHKKKMLWAVAEALKAHSIGVKHEHFRTYMSSLMRLVRKLCSLPHNSHLLSTPGSSTSEIFLKIARQHSFMVIQGKTIDEIFNEEKEKCFTKSNNKVKGYIPPNSYDIRLHLSPLVKNCENLYEGVKTFKNNTNDVKTVLQDKVVNIESQSNHSDTEMISFIPIKNIKNDLHLNRQLCSSLNKSSKR